TSIRRDSQGFELATDNPDHPSLSTDAVVLAIPSYIAAELLTPIAPDLATQLAKIRYLSAATISLGYRKEDLPPGQSLDGFGFLIPKAENRDIVACTWTSTKFDHRSDSDHVLVRAFAGGYSQPDIDDLSDETLLAKAQAEVAALMGITAVPVTHRIFRWKQGSPQYDVGHLDRVAQMEGLASQIPGLYLTGSAYRGVGLPDCVRAAKQTAQLIYDQFDQNQ
ncbi:MAG: protoporphyrinogen oxidase, partial [Chloroflexota bacterium]